jgi:phosphatidylserine decarboxylase
VKFRPKYVTRSLALREGECARCGRCCAIAFRCPSFTDDGCKIHGRHYEQCKAFPIDARDTLLIERMGGECGFRFRSGVPASFPVTRHGAAPIAIAAFICGFAALVAAFFIHWWALLFFAPAAFVVSFFRNPERFPADSAPNAVLSPADGKVVAIAESTMPVSGESAVMVDIFLSIFNVHMNRAPSAGSVSAIKYEKGAFLNALRADAGSENENNTIAIETDSGVHVEVKQISGAIARRIVCTTREGARIEAGERFGMIKFGSRTQLFLPAGGAFRETAKVGDTVRAGETVLGYLG